jgi:hypothetical protein
MPKRSNDHPCRLMDSPRSRYTCKEYREEMTLLNLRQRLYQSDLSEEEATRLKATIERLQQEIGMA